MKKIFLTTLLAGATILSACGQKAEPANEPVQEVQEPKQEVKKPIEESFADLFSDIRLMKKKYVPNQKYNVLTEKTVWFSKAKDIYYAPYDINNDGVDELFLASASPGESKKDQIGVFYLNNGKVERLGDRLDSGNSYLNFDGLVRVYKDGTLYTMNFDNPTAKGAEYIYKLAPNGTSLEIIAQNIFENVTKDKRLEEEYNLNSKELLDTSKLDWKLVEFKN